MTRSGPNLGPLYKVRIAPTVKNPIKQGLRFPLAFVLLKKILELIMPRFLKNLACEFGLLKPFGLLQSFDLVKSFDLLESFGLPESSDDDEVE